MSRMSVLLALFSIAVLAQDGPDDLDKSTSELRPYIERFTADHTSLTRFYNIEASATRRARLKEFSSEWVRRIERLDFDRLSQDGRIDYILFRNQLAYQLRKADLDARSDAEIAPLVPFAETIIALDEARQKMNPVEPPNRAATLSKLSRQIAELRKGIDAGKTPAVKKTAANQAARLVASLRETLATWFKFYNAYDPGFTWAPPPAVTRCSASLLMS